MKKLITLFSIMFLLPFAALAAVEVGKLAPDFSALDSNGNKVVLSELKGTHVVLEWSNHECPFVKKYYSQGNMQSLQKAYTDKGVKWLRIISSAPGKQGHVNAERANEVVAAQGIMASHSLLDESGEIGRLYDAKTTPHMFVIDKAGLVAYAGAIDSIRSPRAEDIVKAIPYVANALDNLLEGKAVEVASTQPYGCSIKY